jgi:O-antigen/teichoic acid export membrane protein
MLRQLASPAWAILEYAWHPLLLFVFTPWFLYHLGTDAYGHWMLLTATVGIGGVLSTGTGAATVKAISSAIGRNAAGDSERAVNASLAIAILGGGVLALLVLAIFWIGGASLLGRMGELELLRLTGIVAAVLLWLEQLDNVFSSAMKGAECFAQAARVEIISKSAQVTIAAVAMVVTAELWALYTSLVLVGMFRLLIKAILARRLLGIQRIRPSLANVRDVLQFAKWGWAQGVGGVMFGVADRILIGSLLGASSLAYYSIASQLAMQVHAVSAAGLSVIFPKVSRMLEHGGKLSLWRVTKLTVAGSLLSSTSLALILLLLGPTILQMWLGAESAGPTAQLLPWLVLAYWILALHIPFYYILLGMGRMRFIALTVLSSGAASVIAVYMAITNLGFIGTPMGRSVYAILSLALVLPLARQVLQERGKRRSLPPIDIATGNERPK